MRNAKGGVPIEQCRINDDGGRVSPCEFWLLGQRVSFEKAGTQQDAAFASGVTRLLFLRRLFLAAAGHLEPVQFFFHPVKGVVTDLIAGPHRYNCVTGGLKGGAMKVGVHRPSGFPGRLFHRRCHQVRGEFLPHGFGNG